MSQSKEFFTPNELATRYDVALNTVYRWMKNGKLKGFRATPTSTWRFTESEVARFENRGQA